MTRRREDGTIDFGADPSVRGELERGRQRQERQHLPKGERSRAARQAEIDARRNRRNIDIPTDLEAQLEKIADQLGVPFSQLLCRLAAEGLNAVDLKALENERVPSRSMRFAFNLPMPKAQKRNRENVR